MCLIEFPINISRLQKLIIIQQIILLTVQLLLLILQTIYFNRFTQTFQQFIKFGFIVKPSLPKTALQNLEYFFYQSINRNREKAIWQKNKMASKKAWKKPFGIQPIS